MDINDIDFTEPLQPEIVQQLKDILNQADIIREGWGRTIEYGVSDAHKANFQFNGHTEVEFYPTHIKIDIVYMFRGEEDDRKSFSITYEQAVSRETVCAATNAYFQSEREKEERKKQKEEEEERKKHEAAEKATLARLLEKHGVPKEFT